MLNIKPHKPAMDKVAIYDCILVYHAQGPDSDSESDADVDSDSDRNTDPAEVDNHAETCFCFREEEDLTTTNRTVTALQPSNLLSCCCAVATDAWAALRLICHL